MSVVAKLLGDINSFLSSNNVSHETLIFLIGLKQKILEECDVKIEQNEAQDIEKILRVIGKRAFVDCFYIFKAEYNDENKDVVSLMLTYGGAKSENSARTKASIGRKIFREGLELEALRNIVGSNRVEEKTKNKALEILLKEGE